MKQFSITNNPYNVGFHHNIWLHLPETKNLRIINNKIPYSAVSLNTDDELKKNIDANSSLRVEFGWSFESEAYYQTIMNECIDKIMPKYNYSPNFMVSDIKCSWLGFVPYNTFERKIYENLSSYALIIFNNELVDYQVDVINFITEHKIFRQHALLRDDRYRFDIFKKNRKNKDQLENLYNFYLESIKETTGLYGIHRDLLEQQIGCHFIYHPDLFLELLNISKLRGEIIE